MRIVPILFLLLLAASARSDDARQDRARASHRYEDAGHWSKIWDHPSRDAWQEPERVVGLMEIEPGMSVADIGAGTGYFNPHLSAAVGPDGMVYAVDIEPAMVEHMRERAVADGTPNVVAVLGALDSPQLPAERVDRILMVDTYHHIDHRVAYFERLGELLGPEGLFINVDWKPGRMELGPSEKHKIAPEEVAAELEEAGYELIASDELKYQYVQLFRLRAQPRGDEDVE